MAKPQTVFSAGPKKQVSIDINSLLDWIKCLCVRAEITTSIHQFTIINSVFLHLLSPEKRDQIDKPGPD